MIIFTAEVTTNSFLQKKIFNKIAAILLIFNLVTFNKASSQEISIIENILPPTQDEALKKINILEKSLMLNKEEIIGLRAATESLKNNTEYTDQGLTDISNPAAKQPEESSLSFVYLSSILYISKDVWAVWVNGNKITSKTNNLEDEFYIKEANKDTILITWSLGLTKWKILTNSGDEAEIPELNQDNKIIYEFKLSPNQTYVLKTQAIIEGKSGKSLQ
jgi:hypothetical protein